MDIKLIIPKKIHNKYTYLLNRFKNLEWSGPAWYKVKTDIDGFPLVWRIVHFHPLDLGSHAATEWEAKDLATILKETYASTPSLKKSYLGLIHSHNTMGAFLSGTDTSTITEMAPDEGFYGSLVVASGGKATHAFGFSYKDQYKYSHCLEIEEDDIDIVSPDFTPMDDWISEADIIEKSKPKWNNHVKPGKQISLLANTNSTLLSNRVIAERQTVLTKLVKDKRKKVEKILDKWDKGELTDIDVEAKLEGEDMNFQQIAVLTGLAEYMHYNNGGYYGIY